MKCFGIDPLAFSLGINEGQGIFKYEYNIFCEAEDLKSMFGKSNSESWYLNHYLGYYKIIKNVLDKKWMKIKNLSKNKVYKIIYNLNYTDFKQKISKSKKTYNEELDLLNV